VLIYMVMKTIIFCYFFQWCTRRIFVYNPAGINFGPDCSGWDEVEN